MRALLDWLDEKPAAKAAKAAKPAFNPGPDVKWPGGHGTPAVLALISALESKLCPAVFEDGDAASLGLRSLAAWRQAIANHPAHGRNWLAKHGRELAGHLRAAIPGLVPPEKMLEGRELENAFLRIFGGDVARIENPAWGGR